MRLLQFLKGHRRRFIGALLLIVASSLFEGVQLSFMLPVLDRIFTNKQIILPNQVPNFVKSLVDQLNTTEAQVLFWAIPIMFLIVFFIKQIVLFFADLLMNDIAQSVMRDVRSKLFERIQTLSLDYFSKKRAGELMSRITNDVATIENAISYAITDFVRQPFLIVVFVYVAVTVHLKGTLIILILVPLIGWPMATISRKLRKLGKSTQEKMADINSHLLETIGGVRILKAFATEKYEIRRFSQQNYDYYRIRMKTLRNLILLGPITEIIGATCGIGVFLLFGYQVMRGELSFGVFAIFF